MAKVVHLFREPLASELDEKRNIARQKWHITYDCFNTRIRDDQVICAKGHSLQGNHKESMPLLSVLAGRSALICKQCKEYDD